MLRYYNTIYYYTHQFNLTYNNQQFISFKRTMTASKNILLLIVVTLLVSAFSKYQAHHKEVKLSHNSNQFNHNQHSSNHQQVKQESHLYKSLHSRRQTQSHKLNGQECIKQKGFVCGTFIQDCCKDGCYKSWFLGPEKCLNDRYLQIQQNKCEDVCKKKGGILCSNLLQDPQCCPQSACTKGITNKCNQTQRLNVTGCYQSNIMDAVTGIFKS